MSKDTAAVKNPDRFGSTPPRGSAEYVLVEDLDRHVRRSGF
jgi:hypothetical protein